MVLEILSLRLAAPHFGSSTYVLSALMSVILGSLSVGYYMGGKKADLSPSRGKLSTMLFLAGAVIFFIPNMSPSIAALARQFGYRLGPLIFGLVLFSIQNVFLGMIPPYAIKLAAKNLSSVGSVSGNLYALSTVGGIAGTLLSGFVLIPLFPMSAIFFGVILALFLTGFLVGGSRETLIFSLAIVLLFWVALRASASEPKNADTMVIYEVDTPYQRILVIDELKRGIRSMILDASIAGGIRLYDNLSAYPYANFFELPFLMNRSIMSVYMFGEGTGIGALQIRMAHPETKVTVAEIDPTVHETAVGYFNVVEDKNLKIEFGDGRWLLKESNESYDLMILDAFSSPYSIPTHLTTAGFFHEISDRLNPDGLLEANVISSLDENESIFLQSLCKTINQEFKYVYLYAVMYPADETKLQNIIVLASRKPLTTPDREDLWKYQNRVFNEAQLADMLDKKLADFNYSNGVLLSDDYSPTDYLMESMIDKHF